MVDNIKLSELAQKTISLIKKSISISPTGVSFLSLKNYTNSYNETSNYLINIGFSYEMAKLKDIQTLKNMDVTNMKWASPITLIEKNRNVLIDAFLKPNENRSKGQKDAYTNINSGLRVHNDTGILYIYGLKVNKTILVTGTYPIVNSKEDTIAKNELRKYLKTNNFVNFAIAVGNTITTAKETIEIIL